MASDGKIPSKTLISIDRAVDVWEIVDISANSTNKTTVNNALGITGNPVGDTDTQSLTNKTLTSPTVSGPTFSGTLIGTYTIGGTPTFPATVVITSGNQSIAGTKTFSALVATAPTITNASITADAYTGFSNANTGTIFGISVTSSKIPGASLANSSVTANQLATGAQRVFVATSETTASTSFVDLATVQSITVTIGVNGLLLVGYGAQFSNSGANSSEVAIALSGTNTYAASVNDEIYMTGTAQDHKGMTRMFTGLSTGSTVVTLKFQVSAGTGTFLRRELWAIPL